MSYKEGQVLTNDEGKQVKLTNNQWVPVQPETKDFSLGEMISNIPSSAAQFGKDIIQPILSPIETAEGLGKLISGGAGKLARYAREQGFPIAPEPTPEQMQKYGGKYPYEPVAEQAGEFMKGRYGSAEAAKQTAMRDPVGLMADVATVLTGGGALAAKAPSLMGKVGRGVQKVGMALEPINLMKGVAKTGLAQIPRDVPVSLYKSAAKFPTGLDVKYGMGTQSRLAETALKRGLMPTEKGVLKLAEYEKDLGVRIGGLIDDVAASGKSVPKSKVFKHLKEARRSVGGARVGAQQNIQQIDKIAKELNSQMRKIKGDSLTPRQLQDLKVSAQKAAKYEPGTVRETGTELGSKAVAKAAKEQMEELIPEIQDINKELGALKELKKPLTQAASRIERRDLMGIGTPIKAMAGGEMGGIPGAGAGFLAGMAESKKAQLALKLRKIQDAGLGNLIDQSLMPTLIKQGLWQAGRLEPENENVR